MRVSWLFFLDFDYLDPTPFPRIFRFLDFD